MARYEFMKGLPVITMAEGKHIGRIDDLVVDPERKAVSWLRIHSGGLGMLGGERRWVPVAAVHGLGDDADTIDSEADSRTSNEASEAVAMAKAGRAVIGSKVLTEKGERIGEVRDYEFDSKTFALTSLSVPPAMNAVGESLTIAADKVLTIGQDMIVVASDAVIRPDVVAGT